MSKTYEPLYTDEFGTGTEVVVFLPGLGATTRYWGDRVRPLATTHRVVLVDLLGFGESPKPWCKYSVDRHVQALADVLAHRPPFRLVGHSLGAVLALAYAARYPNQVSDLVLFSLPNFRSESEAYHYFRHGPPSGGWLATNIVLATVACLVTRRLLGWLLPYAISNLPREVVEDLVKHTWRSSTSSLWEVIYRHNPAADVHKLDSKLPVVCIHGDQDTVAPLQSVSQLIDSGSDWKLQVFPGVDHHPFLRETAACLRLIAGQNLE